jgi:hypothetical protein
MAWTTMIGRRGWLAAAASIPTAMALLASGCDETMAFEATETVTVTLSDPANRIELRNVVGDIELIGDPAASAITVEAKKIGRGSTQENADAALKEIVVTIAPAAEEPGVIALIGKQPSTSGQSRGYRVEWKVTAPQAMAVDVVNRVGDIAVVGFTDGAKASADVGDLRAERIAGGLNLRSGVGDVSGEDIDGAMTLESKTGDIQGSASGVIKATTNVGEVSVRLTGDGIHPVTARSNTGDIDVTVPRNWKGRLKASTNVGDLEVNLTGVSGDRSTRGSSQSIDASVNGGGEALLDAGTNVGDVRLRSVDRGG